jgi:hypothetical protein
MWFEKTSSEQDEDSIQCICFREAIASLFFVIAGLFLVSCSNPLGSNSSAQPQFLSPLSLTDNSSVLFGLGSSTGVTWDSANNYLRLDQSGLATDLELDPSWTPAWSNIVGYWKLNGTVGGISNGAPVAATVGSNGVAQNANGTGLAYVAGVLNQGINFDGVDDRVSLGATTPTNFPMGASARTISMWVNLNDTTTRALFNYGSDSNNNMNLIYVNGTLRVAFYSNDYNIFLTPLTNVWEHWVMTYDGNTTLKIYRNGMKAFTNSSITPPNTSSGSDNGIGYYAGGPWFMSGLVDEVAIWNTCLSASAVAVIYQHQLSKHAGTFQSRVMDSFTSRSWLNLNWLSTLPFFKELPDYFNGAVQNESLSDYSSLTNNTLMNGILGLWHFDETSGTTIHDSSGNANNGALNGGYIFNSGGQFASAMTFNGSTGYASLPTNLLTGKTQFTMSVWVNTTSSVSNGTFYQRPTIIGQNTAGAGSGDFGITVNSGYLGMWGGLSSGTDSSVQTSFLINDGHWHHVVATNDGTTVHLYLDGVDTGSTIPAGLPMDGATFFVGAANNNNGASSGSGPPGFFLAASIDELGIWSRPLSTTEVFQVYRRGANRMRYQVRSCPDSTCSTNPSWQGPDNTNQSYFSELNNNVIPNDGGDLTTSDTVQISSPKVTFSNFGALVVPSNRYFQYRAVMESDDVGTGCNYGAGATWCSPELQSVSAGP